MLGWSLPRQGGGFVGELPLFKMLLARELKSYWPLSNIQNIAGREERSSFAAFSVSPLRLGASLLCLLWEKTCLSRRSVEAVT